MVYALTKVEKRVFFVRVVFDRSARVHEENGVGRYCCKHDRVFEVQIGVFPAKRVSSPVRPSRRPLDPLVSTLKSDKSNDTRRTSSVIPDYRRPRKGRLGWVRR